MPSLFPSMVNTILLKVKLKLPFWITIGIVTHYFLNPKETTGLEKSRSTAIFTLMRTVYPWLLWGSQKKRRQVCKDSH